ncbi:transcriptional regulator [Furfurilactobacillus rossiae]|uniref:HTH cro/C1-type domain-containing protein n=3 Tax=Furfurilactobacillus rossiae TaxID=231049 RepID=A0A0R1RBU4_9LACO|nr:hypothetical protein FD35_GL002717 [Furfurilactobacillus rossiae DSM 15814]QFR66900.1 helix-turn-helix domain-containing protein [Furfurilactobacillus rossiae]QLE62394.1 transcriptional regulator [Furfurilactobacillus rossiae]
MIMRTMNDILQEELKDPEFRQGYEYYLRAGEAAVAVYQLRKSLGLSQAELAKRAGKAKSTIARIENGNLAPRLDTLQDIANGVGKEAKIVFI